jgi:hypothetical protein
VAQGYYPEDISSSDLLLRLLCWGVSGVPPRRVSRYAGMDVTALNTGSSLSLHATSLVARPPATRCGLLLAVEVQVLPARQRLGTPTRLPYQQGGLPTSV